MSNYIAYYRVSSISQVHADLELELQRAAVINYIRNTSGIIKEFIEVESGKVNTWPQLQEAIACAKASKAKLVIAKLDRLSRNATFIFTLKESGVDFVCADMPDANTRTIGIFATLAQHERMLISSRTKAALQAKKKQGFKLGKPENLKEEHRLKGMQIRSEIARSNENNRKAATFIESYRKQGFTWLAIANKLNNSGFKTSRGKSFQAVQVQRIFKQST